jgi:cobalamin biosynthesis protein CbiD
MDRQGLRSGYTTGSCATAGAKGAALVLVEGRAVEEVVIILPRGERVRFALRSCVQMSPTAPRFLRRWTSSPRRACAIAPARG